MNPKGLATLIIISITTAYLLYQANPYRNFSELSKFNENTYTLYMTIGTTVETMIRNGDEYFIASNGTTYIVKGEYYIEEYIPAHHTTNVKRTYLNVPFNECNLADPLLSGSIIVPPKKSFTAPINMQAIYNYGKCIIPPLYGAATITVTVNGNTMIARIPDYGITFTLIG